MKKLSPCRLCGGSTIPIPNGIPSLKKRTCWTTGAMDWCGAGKLRSGFHFHVAHPRVPGPQGENVRFFEVE